MSPVKLPFAGLATLQSRCANWQRGGPTSSERSTGKAFELEMPSQWPNDRATMQSVSALSDYTRASDALSYKVNVPRCW
jgi:hypothetical protein